MRLFKNLLILCIVLFTNSISAQYTGVINSNRPGFSESPYSVGTGVYQLETSFFYRKSQIYPTFSRPKSSGADFLFRTSFFKEKLELNANFAFQKEQVAFENIFTSSYFKTGISKLIIAGKYLIYEQKYKDKSKEIRSWKERHRFDWKRLIPSVAGYVGINTGIPDDIYKANSFSPKVGVLLQNDITKDLNVITNIFYDRIGTDLPEFSYIITATYSFNDRWSTFVENQTTSDKFEYTSSLGSGFAFLYNRDIQINSSLRLLADANSTGFYASIGASYRFDRHVDKVTEVDENGNPIEDEEEESATDSGKKKGFFGRLFSKVTKVFKKKGSRAPTKLKDKTIESIKKNTNKDENTINNDSIKKVIKPIRTRPKRVRKKATRIKPVKKEGGGFFGLFKGKSKKEKSDKKEDLDALKKKKMTDKEIAKELKKLEKEQRKLEKEQKKEEAQKKKEEAKKKKKEEKKKKKEDKKKEKEGEDDSGN